MRHDRVDQPMRPALPCEIPHASCVDHFRSQRLLLPRGAAGELSQIFLCMWFVVLLCQPVISLLFKTAGSAIVAWPFARKQGQRVAAPSQCSHKEDGPFQTKPNQST